MGSFGILLPTICQVVLDCHNFIQLLTFRHQGEIHQFLSPKYGVCDIIVEKYILNFFIISAAALLP